MTRRRDLALASILAIAAAGCSVEPAGGGSAPAVGIPSARPSQAAPPQPSDPSPAPSLAPLSADEAWAMLIPGDPASVSYRSPAALMRDSDVVVMATVGELTDGPDFTTPGGTGAGSIVHLASLTLNVERVLRGTVKTREPGTLTLRIWLGVGDPGGYDYADTFASLATSPISGRGVFFLANMAALNTRMGGPPDHPAADPYAYQIQGGQGFLRDVGDRVEPPRLSEDALFTMAGRWQEDLRGQPFDALVRSLDAIAAETP